MGNFEGSERYTFPRTCIAVFKGELFEQLLLDGFDLIVF